MAFQILEKVVVFLIFSNCGFTRVFLSLYLPVLVLTVSEPSDEIILGLFAGGHVLIEDRVITRPRVSGKPEINQWAFVFNICFYNLDYYRGLWLSFARGMILCNEKFKCLTNELLSNTKNSNELCSRTPVQIIALHKDKMFKRSEKKIKAVFKMQFQATQVPQLKAKKLMISLVPVDVGKPTVRLAKVPIVEGICTWESPVYETVKLVQEIKTGRIREKFYYVIVSTGSSKAGFLGEVSLDFADLAEATKPLNLTLPLQTSKSGAILHVTVQRMQGGPDSRHDDDSEAPEDESNDQNMGSYSFDKRNPKSSNSDDLSESSTPHDEQNGSLEDALSDYNDGEARDGVREASNNNTSGRLTNQMKIVERKAELAELEVQSLRKHIMKETQRGQQLAEQIVRLKEEKDALRAECERVKSSSAIKNEEEAFSAPTQKEIGNLRSSLDNVKQELQRQRDLNKKLKSQLQKAEDSNSEFVLAMRDLSKKLDQKNTEISRLSSKIKSLDSGSDAFFEASPRTNGSFNEDSRGSDDSGSKRGNIDELEKLKQKIDDLYSKIEVHKKEKAEMQMDLERLALDYENLEMENKDMSSKIEQGEKEKMEIQQSYTESLATERTLKQQVASLEAENKRKSLQYSESLDMIDELEFQVESLQKELEKQAQVFEDGLQALTEAKYEQEQKAIRAEEALRKARWSNKNVTERLQEEFTQISAEMSLKIEENEILAQEAVTEANDLRQKNEVLEEDLQKAKEELRIMKDQYETILRERSEQNDSIAGISKQSEAMEEPETFQRWKLEKDDLERRLASVRIEAENLMQENDSMKSQIDLKKTKEDNLLLEVKKLRVKNNEVRSLMLEVQLENEGLKKEVSKLQESLHKQEQEKERAMKQHSITSPLKEKSIKYNTKEEQNSVERDCIQAVPANQLEQETMPADHIGKYALNKNEQSEGSCDGSSLLSEVASLKERNKSMEDELKEMRERYSEISLRFAEVEGERQQLVMAVRNLKSGKKN
ncbi:myosin heavy chain-related protein [Striga asiatica]|uniref:Myosin heavy chain-related protein n=1 Tax=Striga asiatica TaxID=4170 RepID=A0A5A7QP75_STRAF|nr:myosin heavy chain-related protein [Striga asiatica]